MVTSCLGKLRYFKEVAALVVNLTSLEKSAVAFTDAVNAIDVTDGRVDTEFLRISVHHRTCIQAMVGVALEESPHRGLVLMHSQLKLSR